MTQAQMLRMERRAILERRRMERRAETITFVAAIALLLLAFALAGTLDYQDRTEGLGTDARPSWTEVG